MDINTAIALLETLSHVAREMAPWAGPVLSMLGARRGVTGLVDVVRALATHVKALDTRLSHVETLLGLPPHKAPEDSKAPTHVEPVE